MSVPFEIREATGSTLNVSSRSLLFVSLCLGLSILYQVYFFDFSDGELIGGERQRLYLKLVSSAFLLWSIRKYLSVSALQLNLILKIPLLFVSLTIVAIAPFLSSALAQALNLFFFLPLLLVDWNRPGGAELYKTIWKTISAVVVVQLLLDPLCKLYFLVAWSNGALIGGMGNPNVFGIFLIASGLACAILLRTRFRLLSTILFLAATLTGSLVSSMVGLACVFVQLVRLLYRSPLRSFLLGGVVVALMTLSTLAADVIAEPDAIAHEVQKLGSLRDLLSGGAAPDSATVTVRMEYLERGLSMIGESPLSLLVGHPDAMPMYNGDGLWVSFLVTYGLPVTLCFLFANLIVSYRGWASGSRDLFFSACVVGVMLVFFITNRILDYWPAALIYILAFGYLTNRGVRRIHAPERMSRT